VVEVAIKIAREVVKMATELIIRIVEVVVRMILKAGQTTRDPLKHQRKTNECLGKASMSE